MLTPDQAGEVVDFAQHFAGAMLKVKAAAQGNTVLELDAKEAAALFRGIDLLRTPCSHQDAHRPGHLPGTPT